MRFREGEREPGLELRLDPAGQAIQLGSMRKRLAGLPGRSHRIEVFAQEEIIDVCIDDTETLIVCERPRPGSDLVLWSENASAEIRDVELRLLVP